MRKCQTSGGHGGPYRIAARQIQLGKRAVAHRHPRCGAKWYARSTRKRRCPQNRRFSSNRRTAAGWRAARASCAATRTGAAPQGVRRHRLSPETSAQQPRCVRENPNSVFQQCGARSSRHASLRITTPTQDGAPQQTGPQARRRSEQQRSAQRVAQTAQSAREREGAVNLWTLIWTTQPRAPSRWQRLFRRAGARLLLVEMCLVRKWQQARRVAPGEPTGSSPLR